MNLDEIKSEFFNSFECSIDQSLVKLYGPSDWEDIIKDKPSNICGFYSILNRCANLKKDSKFLISTFFHEFLGHGSFVENSEFGLKFYDYEKRFESGNDVKKEYTNFFKSKERLFEGFAIFIEEFFSNMYGVEELFCEKLKESPKRYKKYLHEMRILESKFSRYGVLYECGFPRKNIEQNSLEILKKYYSDDFNNIISIILFGSQREFSDIDLFILHKDKTNYFSNKWLDIHQMSLEEHLFRLNNLDPGTTDPLFTGNIIYGDKTLIETFKRLAENRIIDDSVINYNLFCSQEVLKKSRNDKHEKENRRYSKVYQINASLLSQGIKKLTLEELIRG